jgi:hypothetical protein
MILSNQQYSPIFSPDGERQFIFGEVQEYSMGGAYACPCYVSIADSHPRLLHNMCAGFPLWTSDNAKIYFPVWTLSKENYRLQRLACYEISSNKLSVFEQMFSTISLQTLSENKLEFIESELFNPKKITFDLSSEKIAETTEIAHKIIIYPTEGIGFINLGDTKKYVREKVLNQQFFEGTPIDYCTTLGFHVHYDNDEKVEFIEIMGDMQSVFELYEKNPFTADVDEMVKVLTDKNGTEINLIEAPTSYKFLDLSLGIFRNSTPENMLKYIEQSRLEEPEAFKSGTPEWMLEDLEKAKHFQTIGLGNQDYFRNEVYFIK